MLLGTNGILNLLVYFTSNLMDCRDATVVLFFL